ncbi:MAG: sigma-70 family RNA polymerase sigma factor [Alphaproteobacteria bacterium]|nr:MAG: sigma-70 family RNA polymerase sigma factor [Alphaproteobacteria bacterium]
MKQAEDADHTLMRRIAGKDAKAYRTLVGKYLNFCVRFAERMTGSRQDAEEIAQDVCLKIWNEAPRWQPQAKFSTWLYRVVTNRCIDYKRKVVPLSVVDAETLADSAPAADDTIIRAQQSARVRGALQQLPERQRAAVVLSYYEAVSNQEAADAMGMQLGAFQQLLFRARQSLKEKLIDERLEMKNGR